MKVAGALSLKLLVRGVIDKLFLCICSIFLAFLNIVSDFVSTGLLRCGKSCRLRWINYLRPDLKRGNFTEEEDEIIIKLHSLLGNK